MFMVNLNGSLHGEEKRGKGKVTSSLGSPFGRARAAGAPDREGGSLRLVRMNGWRPIQAPQNTRVFTTWPLSHGLSSTSGPIKSQHPHGG